MKRIISLLLLLAAMSALPYVATAQDMNMQKMEEIISELKKQFPSGTIFEVTSKSIYEYMYDNKNVEKDIQNRYFEDLLKDADSLRNAIDMQNLMRNIPDEKDSIHKYISSFLNYEDSVSKKIYINVDSLRNAIDMQNLMRNIPDEKDSIRKYISSFLNYEDSVSKKIYIEEMQKQSKDELNRFICDISRRMDEIESIKSIRERTDSTGIMKLNHIIIMPKLKDGRQPAAMFSFNGNDLKLSYNIEGGLKSIGKSKYSASKPIDKETKDKLDSFFYKIASKEGTVRKDITLEPEKYNLVYIGEKQKGGNRSSKTSGMICRTESLLDDEYYEFCKIIDEIKDNSCYDLLKVDEKYKECIVLFMDNENKNIVYGARSENGKKYFMRVKGDTPNEILIPMNWNKDLKE